MEGGALIVIIIGLFVLASKSSKKLKIIFNTFGIILSIPFILVFIGIIVFESPSIPCMKYFFTKDTYSDHELVDESSYKISLSNAHILSSKEVEQFIDFEIENNEVSFNNLEINNNQSFLSIDVQSSNELAGLYIGKIDGVDVSSNYSIIYNDYVNSVNNNTGTYKVVYILNNNSLKNKNINIKDYFSCGSNQFSSGINFTRQWNLSITGSIPSNYLINQLAIIKNIYKDKDTTAIRIKLLSDNLQSDRFLIISSKFLNNITPNLNIGDDISFSSIDTSSGIIYVDKFTTL